MAGGGAARRRRDRRLRAAWHHEQLSVKMAVAAALHHSAQRGAGPATYSAPRRQTTATEGEVREPNNAPRSQKPPLPGEHPGVLKEPEVQGRIGQHSGIGFELVQALDVPVLQMVEQPVEVDSFFRNFVPAVAEQVIEVPVLALPGCAVQRSALSEPQTVEQLVEVPTVVSFSSLQQSIAEQFIDIPVPRLGGSGRFPGSHPGPGSLQRSVEQNVNTPVPHGRGRVGGTGRQGFHPRQSSTAVSEQTVSPAPRREGTRGGLQGFSSGQSSTQRMVEQNVYIPVPRTRARGGLRGSPPGQGLQRTVEQVIDIPVSRTRDDGGLPGAHLHQGSTARGGALGAQARLEAELEELLAISAETGFTPQQQARFREVLSLLYGPG